MALYREELDRMPCGKPGCDHTAHEGRMFLNPACHPGRGLEVAYDAAAGVLVCVCKFCKQPVCDVAVASRGN